MVQTSVSHREIWRIAYPIMLGNLAQTIITFTDTAFLGHLGTIELSASMMAGLYYYVFTTLAMGFAVGIQIFIARRYGERNYEKIGEVFQHGSLFVLLLGLLLFGALFCFSNKLMNLIIDSDNIYRASMQYISIRQFGIFFVVFNFMFRSFFIGLSNTKAITFSTLMMAVINIFFDWCLIYGNCHFPAMGIGGAALASLMAEIAAFCFFWVYTFVTIPHQEYGMFRWHQWQFPLLKAILKISFPCMLQRLFSFGAWFAFFILIEKMGELAIGISSIVRSTYMILIIPGFAFSATANTLTSRLIGEGKSDEVLSMLGRLIKSSLLCSAIIVILTAIMPEWVLRIYSNDMLLTQAAVPTIYVICLATFLLATAMPFFEAVSGTGNTAAAMYLETGVLILYVGYTYAMSLTARIELVWTAELLYNGLMGILAFFYLKKINWQKNKL